MGQESIFLLSQDAYATHENQGGALHALLPPNPSGTEPLGRYGSATGIAGMGLTSFVQRPEVREKLAQLQPDSKRRPRRLRLPLQVPCRSQPATLVGTAFDYLLRFELQRRAPHAIAFRWPAEDALPHVILRSLMQELSETDLEIKFCTFVSQIRSALNDAKEAVAHYLTLKSPTETEQANLAVHAIRLARLERVRWLSEFHFDFEQAISPELIQELLELLAIVPYGQLLDDQIMLLGPTFGEVSEWIAGAQADIITGDLLLDVKTTVEDLISSEYLNQIFGYYLLARWQRRMDPSFPLIRRLGIYLARYGCLWSLETSEWTTHPMFPAVEEWFIQHVRETYEARKSMTDLAPESMKVAEPKVECEQQPESMKVAEPKVECEQQPVTSPTNGVVAKVWRWVLQLLTSFCRLFRFGNRRGQWECRSHRSTRQTEGTTPLIEEQNQASSSGVSEPLPEAGQGEEVLVK